MAKVKRLKIDKGFRNLVFLIIIIAVAVAYISNQYKSNLFEVIEYDFYVDDSIGFNLDNETLHFGTLKRGTRGFRTIVIESGGDYDVNILNKGNEFVYLDESKFFIEVNQTKKIRAYVQVPSDAEKGLYEGELLLIFNER